MINVSGKNTKAERLAKRAEIRKVPISVRDELNLSRIEPKSPMKNRLLKRCSGPECPNIDVKNFQKGELEALKPGSNP
jgi:hypothetical protein